MPDAMEMPRYLCHKKVWALKIAAIEFNEDGTAKFAPVDTRYGTIDPKTEGYMSRFKGDEKDLGYFVIYDDGYESWSPSKAFEDGYTKIGD